MRILLLTPNFYPEKTGIGVSATECAHILAQLDHKVNVLTCLPYYPEWRIASEYRGKFFTKEEFAPNIQVKRSWLFVPQKVVTWKRIVHELSFGIIATLRSSFQKVDLFMSISPPLSASTLVGISAKIRRKPFYCYIQDIQPDTAICLGMLSNPIVVYIAKKLEKITYGLADKIMVLSDGMKQNLIKKGVPEEKIDILPLSVDVKSLTVQDSQGNYFREHHKLADKFIILSSGNIGVKHNALTLVRIAEMLKDDPDILFVISGQGSAKQIIGEEIVKKQLKNIIVLPLCERKNLANMLTAANILVVTQRKEILDLVVPSKLMAYFCSKRPIIASLHPQSEGAKLLQENNAGIVTPPEDLEAFVAAIYQLKNQPQFAKELGKRGYQLVMDEFDTRVVKEKYYKKLFPFN